MNEQAGSPSDEQRPPADTSIPAADEPPASPDEAADASSRISHYVEDAYSQVGEPGEGHSWHDRCYRVVRFLQTGWRRKLLGQRLQTRLNYLLNVLLSHHSHAVAVAWSRDDPMHNLQVPDDEHVTIPTLWVVELFPPSEYAALVAAVERNKWDLARAMLHTGESNAERLQHARASRYGSWWRMGDVMAQETPYWYPDGVRRDLPPAFTAVELRGMQVGPSLTAVIGRFHLSADAAASVDKVWHASHEPRLIRHRRGRPESQDRMWAGYGRTQEARLRLHEAARSWMSTTCPGSFAASKEPHPVVDMLLLDQHDPIAEAEFHPLSDPLRALGLTGHSLLHTTSEALPGLLLTQVEPDMCKAFRGRRRTWALWGSRDAAAAGVPDRVGYGSDTDRALGHMADDVIRTDILLLACLALQDMFQRRYAAARDQARSQHGRFRVRYLRRLRASLLTTSIDLTSLARDFSNLDDRRLAGEGYARFHTTFSPRIREMDRARGRPAHQPIDVVSDTREQLQENSELLLAVDRDYRDILSTVASLGASIDTIRVGRFALGVALVSLAVSVALVVIG